MPFLSRRRIERRRDGSIALRLPAAERELLTSLPGQLRALLEAAPDDPSLRRLFPPAYDDDAAGEREYRELMSDELLSGRRRTLEILERTAAAEELGPEEAEAWLTALNDLRLVIGTQLDVEESLTLDQIRPGHPQSREYTIYAYLSWLQEELVEALAVGLTAEPDEHRPS